MGTSVVVLSGKGGVAKTCWQLLMAGEASREGIPTLLLDLDPERNLSHKFKVSLHVGGLGAAFEAAGVLSGGERLDVAAGALRLREELLGTHWTGVDLLPAGASLSGVGQVAMSDPWLLRDMLEASGVTSRYELILLDTAGRTGALVTQAMYAGDVAYAPIGPTGDAVRKALEARARVERIQRAHPLVWAGVVLTGFDQRVGMDVAIGEEARERFGDEVRASVPRRATVHEAFQLTERLGDRPDVVSAALAGVFRGFLRELLAARAAAAVEVRA